MLLPHFHFVSTKRKETCLVFKVDQTKLKIQEYFTACLQQMIQNTLVHVIEQVLCLASLKPLDVVLDLFCSQPRLLRSYKNVVS